MTDVARIPLPRRRVLAWMASFALVNRNTTYARLCIDELLAMVGAERGFGGVKS